MMIIKCFLFLGYYRFYNFISLYKVVEPETFNIFDNIESPLTFNANAPVEVIFIPNPVDVIICLSNPFILYVIFPEFVPGVEYIQMDLLESEQQIL